MRIPTFLLLLLLPVAVHAQTATKEQVIEQIIALPALEDMYSKDKMNVAIREMVSKAAASLGKPAPILPEAALMTDEDINEIKNFARTSYAQHFSLEELQAMHEFYQSPLGASIARKTPKMLADMGPLLTRIQHRKLLQLKR